MKKNLFKELLSRIKYIPGSHNYEKNHLDVTLYEDGIEVESFCVNEYGSSWSNEDRQFVSWEELPNWVMRKLVSYLAPEDNGRFTLCVDDYPD